MLFILIPTAYPQVESSHSIKKLLDDHVNPGCPFNSLCSKNLGKIYQKWNALFMGKKINLKALNKFKNQYGMPFAFWTGPPAKNSGDIAYWDSSCQLKKKAPPIQWAETFAKSVPHLLKKTANMSSRDGTLFYFDRAYALFKNKIQKYIVPRRFVPVFVSHKNLIFTIEKDGRYFQMQMDATGHFKFINNIDRDRSAENIPCPEKLVQAFKKEKPTIEIPIDLYCKKIWDQKDKTFRTILFPWSCR